LPPRKTSNYRKFAAVLARTDALSNSESVGSSSSRSCNGGGECWITAPLPPPPVQTTAFSASQLSLQNRRDSRRLACRLCTLERHRTSQSILCRAKTFLRNHADAIAAIDMFVVPTLNSDRLLAFLVLGHGQKNRTISTGQAPKAFNDVCQALDDRRRSRSPQSYRSSPSRCTDHHDVPQPTSSGSAASASKAAKLRILAEQRRPASI
jgi:hypothetical protein